MEIRSIAPSILRLDEISQEECTSIEEMAERQFLENVDNSSSYDVEPSTLTSALSSLVINGIEKPPKLFTGFDNWNPCVNVRCWYCSLEFTDVPIFIPSHTNIKSNRIEMGVYGIFCSFSCAESHITESVNNELKNRYRNSLRDLFYIKTGVRINLITKSPSKFDMEIYGGDISTAKYKAELKKINTTHGHIPIAEEFRLASIEHQKNNHVVMSSNNLWERLNSDN